MANMFMEFKAFQVIRLQKMNLTAINTNRRLALLLCLAACNWLTLIYLFSSQPAPELMAEIEGFDKLAHSAGYSILGLLIYGVLEQLNKQKKSQYCQQRSC
jgi:VanZ family protein